MALNSTESKYINLALAELMKEAVNFRTLSISWSKSPKQRTIYKALADSYAITYNRLLTTIGFMGTSKDIRELKLLFPKKGEALSEQELDELIERSYDVDKRERTTNQQLINKQLAQAQVIGATYPTYIKDALETLARHGKLEEFIATEKLMNTPASMLPEIHNLPRGNPLKGGLVNKYLSQGKPHSVAVAMAEEEIEANKAFEILGTETIAKVPVSIPKTPAFSSFDSASSVSLKSTEDLELEAAIAKVNSETITISEGDRMLAILEGE